MASVAQWISGARPRTLPNAVAPVIAGTGAAAWLHSAVWWKALLALAVALALIVGVNYANDYSDGIRGTDDNRAGPVRLVGARLATPRSVLAAAVTSLALGAAAGLALALLSRTVADRGRRRLHRRRVAVHRRVEALRLCGFRRGRGIRVLRPGRRARHAVHPGVTGGLGRAWCWRCPSGALSSSVLVANNLRDIPTDAQSGKITLPVRLGDARTRVLYQALLASAGVLTLVLMLATPWCAVGLVATPLALRAARAGAVRPWRARADPGAARHRAGHAGVGGRGGCGPGVGRWRRLAAPDAN